MTARKANARRILTALASAAALTAATLGLTAGTAQPAQAAVTPVPPAHVVVVIFENHGFSQVIGDPSAPYINALAGAGANLTNMYALTHPSQPNYYNLFSGDIQGVIDNTCVTPGFSSAPNLASELIAAGRTWASYNEGLPSQGSTVCSAGTTYAQKHNPWFGFRNVPTSSAYTMAQFPTDYATLPTVSYIVPDLCNDMHDCPVSTGDTWLQNNLGAYANWAMANNSLLVVTFDEDDYNNNNQIATVFYGQPVKAGSTTATSYNHFDLLHTIEDFYTLPHAGNSATATDIVGIWN